MPVTSLEMLISILIVVGFHLNCGLAVETSNFQTPGTFNFRHYCTAQHSSSKYKVLCDGNKHFKDKNLFLDSRSTSGLTDIDLDSFDSINIVSQTPSDWTNIRKISIRRCKKIILHFQSTLTLNELEIDSVDELTLESEHQSTFVVNAKEILLSNIGKLNLTYPRNADVRASVLSLINIKDVNFYGVLQFSGELLTISQSNIDLAEHSTVIMHFSSITLNESSQLYIRECGQLNVSTNNFLIQESAIYLDGQVNITGYGSLGDLKVIKFLKNSFYDIKENHVHIYGDINEIELIENGFYRSEIGDILNFIDKTEGVNFENNHFDCNKCAKKQTFRPKYSHSLGKQNFCDLTCNITLAQYQELYNQERICNRGESQVSGEILCSIIKEPIYLEHGTKFPWWTMIPVIFIVLVFLSIILYFFCKRHSPRFQSMPVESAIVLSPKLRNNQESQRVILTAFNNEVYGRVDNNPENEYEVVDSPRLSR